MRVYFFIGTIDFLLSIIAYTYLRLHFQLARTWYFALVFLMLSLNMIACRVLPENLPIFLSKISAWLSGLWIAVMYYLLILSIIHGCLHILDKLFHFQLPHTRIAATAIVFCILFIVWGTYRAFNPTIRQENIVSTKLPPTTRYKIIFLTDIHLGQVLGRSYAERLVARVNEQNPDLILIAGDILDERIRYVLREDSLSPFANLKSKYGTYMAYGNHDYLDRPLLWEQMLEEQKIHVLRNKSVIINENLRLIGINDWSRNKTIEEIKQHSDTNSSYYSILMDHQPRRMDAAAKYGYNLYLSGHTHTGQLYPNRQITKRMYRLDYGRTLIDQTTAITNNGYGFWGPPVRTEIAPELVVITVQGK